MNALDRAIEASGGQTALAAAMGVTVQAVNQWRIRGKAPATRCRAIEQLTGVSVHRLRPDVFGPPEEVA